MAEVRTSESLMDGVLAVACRATGEQPGSFCPDAVMAAFGGLGEPDRTTLLAGLWGSECEQFAERLAASSRRLLAATVACGSVGSEEPAADVA